MHLLFLISFIVAISSQAYLRQHNNARGDAVPSRKPVRKSSKLERNAKNVAEWLCRTKKYEHSNGNCRDHYADGCRPPTGENIAAGQSSLRSGIDSFIREKSFIYKGKCQSGKVCGHYLQIISRDVEVIGCAFKKCNDNYRSRTVCHYTDSSNKYAFTMDEELQCEETEDHYDGNMCLYANGDDAEPMVFELDTKSGCDFEDKLYKAVDAAHNKYYLHFNPESVDVVSNETLNSQWLVSRDYVSDIAHFGCDASKLMECSEPGKWSKTLFEEVGVSQQIDDNITIKKCPFSLSEKEGANAANGAVINIVIVLCVLAVIVIVAAAIFFIHRSRKKQSKTIKHLELEEEDEVDEVDGNEQTIQIVQDVTA